MATRNDRALLMTIARRDRRLTAGTLEKGAGLSAVLKLQAKLEAEGYEVVMQLLAPGTSYGEHGACETRLEAVFSGRLRIVFGRLERELNPGDWLEVPRGVKLWTEVVGDDPVLCLLAVRNCPAT